MIKSKFSFLSVYFSLAVICFFIFGAISGALIFGVQQSLSTLVFGALAAFAGYYVIRQMIVIKVFPDRIELKSLLFRQTIFRDDIRTIDLGSRARTGFLSLKWSASAVVIKWGRSDEIVLSDTFYRNMPQVKQALHQNFLASSAGDTGFSDEMPGAVSLPEGAEAAAATFAGHPLLNIQTILFLVYIIVISIALRPIRSDAGSIVYSSILFVVFIPMYLIVGRRLYYFKVSDEHLIVRNHFFPWYTKGFPFKDISNIVFESSIRRTAGLRVNTHGYFSRQYTGGSLQRTGWLGLQQALEEKGVSVNNELPL